MLNWSVGWLSFLEQVGLQLFLHLREEISIAIDRGPNLAWLGAQIYRSGGLLCVSLKTDELECKLNSFIWTNIPAK